jgi:hypothetical protein
MEKYRNMHIKYTNLKRITEIKMTFMDPQYLKYIIKNTNLDYKIIRQAIIIILCVINGGFNFRSKNSVIGLVFYI